MKVNVHDRGAAPAGDAKVLREPLQHVEQARAPAHPAAEFWGPQDEDDAELERRILTMMM